MCAEAAVQQAEQGRPTQATSLQAACPVCSGVLVPMRGSVRCSRCQLTLCEGCEGGTAEDYSCTLTD